MFNFFSKNKKSGAFENPVKTDIHSHLLPSLDDGVKSFEESIEILRTFESLGYEKVITTPHIMKEFYDNDLESIAAQYELLSQKLIDEQLKIKVEFAAEYYLDEFFIEKLNKQEPLLSFGKKYVLMETSFYNAPVFLKDVFFKINTLGYRPVFAHPERYSYLQHDEKILDELNEMQVYFQINIGSLIGSYGPHVKKLAEKMIEKGYIHFIGSDCHNMAHLEMVQKALKSKIYRSLPFEKLLNNALVS